MASLPSDRTKLALAQSNQNPGNVIGSSQNKNALTEAYDTIDLLNQKVDALLSAYSAVGGAATIGTSPITGLNKTNVQAILADIEAQVQAIVASAIPIGSITTTMIQDFAVTATKLALNSINYANHDANTQTDLNGGLIYAYKNIGGAL